MSRLLVDTNVLVDVLEDDPQWADWSIAQLRARAKLHALVINPVIYAEMSLSFSTLEALDDVVSTMELELREIPRPALFLDAAPCVLDMAFRHGLRAGDGLERGGLASAVGADQADQFARKDLEAHALDGLDTAVSHLQAADFEKRCGHVDSLRSQCAWWPAPR